MNTVNAFLRSWVCCIYQDTGYFLSFLSLLLGFLKLYFLFHGCSKVGKQHNHKRLLFGFFGHGDGEDTSRGYEVGFFDLSLLLCVCC